MPNSLTDLVIREVSLVDSPANAERGIPRARVAIFKRATSKRDSAALKAVVIVKLLYPPLGNSSEKPKARTFKEVYADLEQLEEFKDIGDEFQEQVNALCQAVWTILADESVKNKQAAIEATAEQFLVSVKEGLSEEDESLHKAIHIGGYVVSKADGKTYSGKAFPKSDFAYTPDDEPTHWKLRLTKTPGGAPDAGIIGAAVAALGQGFRGNKVQIPAEALASVKAKVRAAWEKCHPEAGADEVPAVIRKGVHMTLEQLEAEVVKLQPQVATLTEANAVLKSENALVLKMSKKERKLYASMSDDERKSYMAADTDKRKEMMGACKEKAKEKSATDSMDEATRKRFDAAGPIEKAAIVAQVLKAAKKENDDEEDEDDDETAKALKMANAALTDRVAKAETNLAEIAKASRREHFTKRAETELPNTAGKPFEKGEMLMQMAEHAPGGEDGPVFKGFMQQLVAADGAMKAHFVEVGKSGGDIPALKAFDAKVEQIAKRDKIDTPHAIEKLMMEDPAAYLAYEADQRAVIRAF